MIDAHQKLLLYQEVSDDLFTYTDSGVLMKSSSLFTRLAVLAAAVFLTGCGTIGTLGKLEDGAGAEASRMWDRWVRLRAISPLQPPGSARSKQV